MSELYPGTEAVRKTASAWSGATVHNPSTRTRWWFHPVVMRHRNMMIAEEDNHGVVSGDIRFLRQRKPDGYERAVSVGCGTAYKELSMIRSGVVSHFTLYELAKPRIDQALKLAKDWGLSSKITIRDELQLFEEPGEYDLVYWNSSLHHMFDTSKAIKWSKESLRSGGAFYMNDCIAPSRLQYTDQYLEAASRFRECLPERLLQSPRGKFPRKVEKIDANKLALADPSECADSASIVPALRRWFSSPTIVYLGGVIYSCALNEIIANFGDEEEALLKVALQLDELYCRQGLSEYAIAFAQV